MLGLGIGVAAKLLWDALNWRPAPSFTPLASGDTVEPPVAQDAHWSVSYSFQQTHTDKTLCPNTPQPGTGFTQNNATQTLNAFARRLIVGPSDYTQNMMCGAGTNVSGTNTPFLRLVNNAGQNQATAGTPLDSTTYNSTHQWQIQNKRAITRITRSGIDMAIGTIGSGVFAPGTQPLVPTPLPATAPEPFRLPAPNPVPTILPATLPGTTPAPAPAPAPGGLPATAPATAPAPTTVPTVTTTITRATPGSQPQTLTATGVTTAPAPAPITQTPAQAVLIGTALIGGPGAAPPPGPAGTAAELGRIEKKMELALDKLNPLGGLAEALGLLGVLLSLMDEEHGGGSYSIRPACGTDAQGDPLPVIEVPIAGGLGVVGAIVPRLDAIAELLDLHKQLRQPVCKGKPTGDPVTVTGVELD